MRRAVLNGGDRITAEAHVDGFRFKAALVTLTYAPECLWGNRHVSSFLRHCRQWLKRRGHRMRYVWVAELTKRGAVHFHLVVWLPKGLTLPKPDKQGWWPHGHSRIEWARRPVGYLAKYASKGSETTHFPKGLRLHSRGGLSDEGRRVVSWWLLPRYVRRQFVHMAERVTRAPGGGWVNHVTGEWLPAIQHW